MKRVIFIGKVVRFELAPAEPLSKYMCFEVERDIDFGEFSDFRGRQVKVIIEEIKNESTD